MVTTFKWNGRCYKLYWDTALDGKTWCRVKVIEKNGHTYQYRYYFRTKKAAKIHIMANDPITV